MLVRPTVALPAALPMLPKPMVSRAWLRMLVRTNRIPPPEEFHFETAVLRLQSHWEGIVS